MEKVGFIGACDKTNLIMYIAKTLQYVGKRVLVIDTTKMQKTKYIVPTISPTKAYVTDYERMDFAVGFENMTEIYRYIGLKDDTEDDKVPYDYVLIDIDSESAIENFGLYDSTSENYFLTTFEMYSLRKSVEILQGLKQPVELTKILYNYKVTDEDEDYLNYLLLDIKAIWRDVIIYLPISDYNNQIMEDNQRVFRLRIKKLSPDFQEGIYTIVQDILKEKNTSRIKKSIKE